LPDEGGEAWQAGVVLESAAGRWSAITAGVMTPPAGAVVLPGPVLPGQVNAHSHAFQRAFAGLAERLPAQHHHDDFWSWRDRMYGVALRVTPAQLRAVAAQLYLELLRGGYTQVCEFHYLHHDPAGQPYDDAATLSWALVDAAADAGIGLTILPVLYERAGFSEAGLRADQRRFATTVASVLDLRRRLHGARPLLEAGLAIHSLRAAHPASIIQLVDQAGDVPLHIHVAEQRREVDDCLAQTGRRPIAWLAEALGGRLDARFQLVHATHAAPEEIEAVGRSGAGVVLCPSTEANLGDGLPDLPRWLAGGVPLGLGSDSQIGRGFVDELRWLEYGQRLVRHARNVAASTATPATAARLFAACGRGGAAGQQRWGLRVGARADLLVIDDEAEGLRGVPASHLLDALVFASSGPVFREVVVAGATVIQTGRHARQEAIGRAFGAAMAELWDSGGHGA
jgi:formimidoylglutamate deiminase